MFSSVAAIASRVRKRTPSPDAQADGPQGDPVAPDAVLQIGAAIKSVIGLTEERFLAIGRGLGSSVEILERLTALFGKLQVELDSPEMRAATEGLARVASQTAHFASAQHNEHAALGELSQIAAGLGRRIDEIHTQVRTINVLTVNAKITAADLGTAGGDFLTYIGEIGQSLAVTETNLRNFRNDLLQVSEHLREASASEAEFNSREAKAVAVVPQQLSQSVDLIAKRRQDAASATGSVSTKSQQISDGIGRVIMALQIGDATRQRMEHAQTAADLLAQMLGDGAAEPWAALPVADRESLVRAGCALQAAQLEDTADEFAREVGSVRAALAQLSADAHAIVHLSERVFGATGKNSAFLDELEGDVRKTHDLLEGFHAVSVSADRSMASVLEIVTRLANHIGTVRAVEADIRIMGVNATLRSARLGTLGTALGVVAEEVTKSSARTAVEAKAATAEVEKIVVTARSLVGQEQAKRVAEITEVTDLMAQSTARLRGVSEGLAAAFEALERDGLAAAQLIEDTTASLAVVDEIDASLRRAAGQFDALTKTTSASSLPATDADSMYRLIAAHYTMAREREVFARIAPASAAAVAAAAPAAAATAAAPAPSDIDDMLF